MVFEREGNGRRGREVGKETRFGDEGKDIDSVTVACGLRGDDLKVVG